MTTYFTPQLFVSKAIEGGFLVTHDRHCEYDSDLDYWYEIVEKILLDRAAWRAVGKTQGWTQTRETTGNWDDMRIMHETLVDTWKYNMHCMIDHLASGGTPESFLATISVNEE